MRSPETIRCFEGGDPAAMADGSPESRPWVAGGRTTRTAAIQGSLWVLGGFGASQLLRLGANIVLAHLVFPEAFGLMAIVFVCMHGAQMCSDFGIARTIVQNKHGTQSWFLNTAWTIQIIRSFVLWGLICVVAAPMASFFEQPLLRPLLMVGGFGTVIRGFTSTSLLTLRREMAVGTSMGVELVAQAASAIAMIGWALVHASVWALVAGNLAGSTVRLIVSHTVVRRNHDSVEWNGAAVAELVRFGKWILASTLLTFVATRGDSLILGKLLTMRELGVYSIAIVSTRAMLSVVSRLTEAVIFPILARGQDDQRVLVATFIRTRWFVLLAGAGGCAAMVVGAPLFFEILYDQRYSGAGEVAQWLVLVTWTSILVDGLAHVRLALGESRVQFLANLIRTSSIGLAVLGYSVAALPGFIVGLSLGALFMHLYLVGTIPYFGRKVVLQSALFSLALALYVGGALGAIGVVNALLGTAGRVAVIAALAGAPCAATVLMVYVQVFRNRSPLPARRLHEVTDGP